MRRRRRGRRLLLTAAACAFAAGAAPALAQDQGPVVFTKHETHPLFSLEPVHGDISLLYRGQRDSTNDKTGGLDQNFDENRFEETLTLATTGAIYHPNLVSLDLEGTFGLFQDDIKSNQTGNDNQDGTLYTWDATATILRKEDIVPSLYSRRTRQLITHQFGPAFDDTLTTTGAVLDIRNKTVPTRLEISHTEDDQAAIDPTSGAFNEKRNTFLWHSEYRPTSHQTFAWDYTYNNVEQSGGSNLSAKFDTHDATLTHNIQFGSKDQSYLASTVHYFKQEGDFPVEQFHWDELLRLQHTDNFDTHYRYLFDKQSFSGSEQTTNRGTAGFTHHLYKSLTTDGTIGAEDISRSDGSDTFAYFGDLNFDYKKLVPLGRLDLFTDFGYRHEDNTARSGTTQILDQPATVSDIQPIVIVGPNINPRSVIVTDPSGLLIYTPGIDYTVDAFANRLEINRVIGGRLNAGDTVFIDYALPPQPKNTSVTTNFAVGGRYDIERGFLRGLGLYARYAKQDQSIDAGGVLAAQLVENSYTDLLIGSDYHFWLMEVGAEQEWHDSTISPFDATRFWARFKTAVAAYTDIMLTSAYDIINYTDENNRVALLTVSGTVSHQFTNNLSGVATVLFRNEENDNFGHTTGWEEQVQLQWRHRQTSVFGQIRNATLDTEQTSQSFQFFEIGVKRRF